MGLFPMDCKQCGKPFMWFSVNMDQRCWDCQQQKPVYKRKCEKCGHLVWSNDPITAKEVYCSEECMM